MEWASQACGRGRRDDLVLSSCVDETCLVDGLAYRYRGPIASMHANVPRIMPCHSCAGSDESSYSHHDRYLCSGKARSHSRVLS